jgi:single-strand DNA-binding protein
MCIARFTLAVDRRFKKQGEQSADFISCVCFGKTAEFIEKYCYKGTKLAVSGRIQTGSYTNRDGQKVYTTEVALDEVEFAESRATAAQNQNAQTAPQTNSQPQNTQPTPANNVDAYVNIPDSIDGDLPFA